MKFIELDMYYIVEGEKKSEYELSRVLIPLDKITSVKPMRSDKKKPFEKSRLDTVDGGFYLPYEYEELKNIILNAAKE